MSGLPKFVYLITVDGEWPVSAIADDHPNIAVKVEREVARRKESGNVWRPDQVHVWKVPVSDAREVDLMPSAVTQPAIRERLMTSRLVALATLLVLSLAIFLASGLLPTDAGLVGG